MTIKPCKECGAPISDKADKCPNCGIKQKKKTSVLTWIVLGVIVFTVLIGFFSGSNETTSTNSSNNNEKNKAGVMLFYAQEKIKANAKDPASVQFRGEQLHEVTDQGAVACGQYNAKNSFGAFTGFKGFVAVEKDQTLYVESGANANLFAQKWNKYCVSK